MAVCEFVGQYLYSTQLSYETTTLLIIFKLFLTDTIVLRRLIFIVWPLTRMFRLCRKTDKPNWRTAQHCPALPHHHPQPPNASACNCLFSNYTPVSWRLELYVPILSSCVCASHLKIVRAMRWAFYTLVHTFSNVNHNSSSRNELFENAHKVFLACLSDKEKASFTTCSSPDELLATLGELKLLSTQRQKKTLNRCLDVVKKLNDRLRPYFDALNVIASAQDTAAFAYGAFRIVLEVCASSNSQF